MTEPPGPEEKAGQALRRWREARRWTRKEAAEKLGVSERTIENWEQGVRTPPALQVLERLLRSGRRLDDPHG